MTRQVKTRVRRRYLSTGTIVQERTRTVSSGFASPVVYRWADGRFEAVR